MLAAPILTDLAERERSAEATSASVDTAVVDSGADAFERAAPDEPLELRQLGDQPILDDLRRDSMRRHRPLSYATARNIMFARDGIEDVDGRIEGFYTGRTIAADGSRTPSTDCRLADGTSVRCELNTEHLVPLRELRRHLGATSAAFEIARADLHHLAPTDSRANRARYHYPFGVTLCHHRRDCAFDEETRIGPDTSGASAAECTYGGTPECVVMVRPDRRGDAARATFYLSMRYRVPIPAKIESILRIWHAQDPPDYRERVRNEEVAAAQGNENPFIVDSSLVGRIDDF